MKVLKWLLIELWVWLLIGGGSVREGPFHTCFSGILLKDKFLTVRVDQSYQTMLHGSRDCVMSRTSKHMVSVPKL